MASWVLSECGLRPFPIIRFYSKPIPSIPSNTNNNGLKVITLPGSSPFKVSTWCRKRSFVGFLNVSAPLEVVETINGVEEEEEDDGGFDPAAPPPFNLADIDVFDFFSSIWTLIYVFLVLLFFLFSVDMVVSPTTRRISHRTHNQNHGHVENDNTWHPLFEKIYKSLDNATRLLRFTLPFPMLAYPIYMWSRSPGKSGSHFDSGSDLFGPNERTYIITSIACWAATIGLLVYLSFAMGPTQLLKLYGIPYWIFFMWLDLVTYLHHHGHDEKFLWYRGKLFERRAYDTRLRLRMAQQHPSRYRNSFYTSSLPQIPRYHLIEATETAKSMLGKYYREPQKSGPFPFYLLGILVRSLKKDHYVSDTGDVVFYQTNPQLYGANKSY
ncbi:Omega-3 fatty acid desaturase [Hibiscus syriacus]|uniref:Omega-3 fatty acid desaturase n=1 Tax=Hibiscus syriacus TaxID=106335 RepID=A0A6A3A2V5_HIBSY|nr:Omega-3 fatty acid desaturase [Hibiscus syriacus]